MKYSFFILLFSFVSMASQAQTDSKESVRQVLERYKRSIEKLGTTGISTLFSENSSVYEGGKSEGTIQHYLAHHLGPELKEFKSFAFSEYKVNIVVCGNCAYSEETYNYTITLAKDKREIRS